MAETICPGLPASWINAWLAAVGATVLDSRIRLRWTMGRTPAAVLVAAGVDPVEALAASWPDREMLSELPIAERWRDTPPMPRRIAVEAFQARARAARGHPFSWTLSSTVTDLSLDAKGEVAHAPFDPAGPGTIKWLHHRLLKVHGEVEPSAGRLTQSLLGTAERITDNGLGFDLTRMGSQADGSAMTVDPVVEVLAFFGLALLPVRGTGTDASRHRSSYSPAVQRGWVRARADRRRYRFKWPAWSPALDRAAIDALLDIWKPDEKRRWDRCGVHAGWQTVQFKPRATADATRAFGAERI
ncbi:MAG: hypothetical protein OXP69_03235 [Spirochaetaceae bacterium]|nr:hypothetical protein [Spirochaetaceae bacterium]